MKFASFTCGCGGTMVPDRDAIGGELAVCDRCGAEWLELPGEQPLVIVRDFEREIVEGRRS